jgi:hypothetical protein
MAHILQGADLFEHHFRGLAQRCGITDEQSQIHIDRRMHCCPEREIAKLDGTELPEFICQPQVGYMFILILHTVTSLLCEAYRGRLTP